MKLKCLAIALIATLFPVLAHAQGSQFTAGPFSRGGFLYVCPAPSGGTPCPAPVAIFADAALSVSVSNPIQMSAGNTVSFYAAGGQYTLQYPATGFSQLVGGGSSSSSPSSGIAVIDPLATKYGAKADGHSIKDATITSGSNIVTCPNANCHFLTTAIVGEIIFVGPGIGLSGGYSIPASTTITSVDSDTQVHISANATANATGTATLTWGHVDQNTAGAGPLQLAWNDFMTALGSGPALFKIPCGMMLVDAGVGANLAGASAFPGTVAGCGPEQSILVPTPNFNWTFMGTGVGQFFYFGASTPFVGQPYIHDFTIYGMGANSNCPPAGGYYLLKYNQFQSMLAMNVYTNSYCSGVANLAGGQRWGPVSMLINVQSDFANGMVLDTGNQPIVLVQPFVGDANPNLQVLGNGTVDSYGGSYAGSQCGQGIVMSSASTWNAYNDTESPTFNMAAGSVLNLNESAIAANNCSSGNGAVTSGAAAVTVRMKNSSVSGLGTTTLAFNGTNISIVDEGGNTFVPGTVGLFPAGSTLTSDGHFLNGSCTGVATASQTLGLFNTGPNVTLTTCTSTTIGSGVPLPQARTLKNLVVSTTAAGTNASSGVVTVLRNGIASTITCTIGTGTSCVDTLHSVAANAGDLISIQFTTQAADTLAGVKAFVMWQ